VLVLLVEVEEVLILVDVELVDELVEDVDIDVELVEIEVLVEDVDADVDDVEVVVASVKVTKTSMTPAAVLPEPNGSLDPPA
jgi:hypothetical protein